MPGVTVKHRSRVARRPEPAEPAPGPPDPRRAARRAAAGGLRGGARARWARTSPPAGSTCWACRRHAAAAGPEAVVEITGLRNPCVQLDGFRPASWRPVLDRDAGRPAGPQGRRHGRGPGRRRGAPRRRIARRAAARAAPAAEAGLKKNPDQQHRAITAGINAAGRRALPPAGRRRPRLPLGCRPRLAAPRAGALPHRRPPRGDGLTTMPAGAIRCASTASPATAGSRSSSRPGDRCAFRLADDETSSRAAYPSPSPSRSATPSPARRLSVGYRLANPGAEPPARLARRPPRLPLAAARRRGPAPDALDFEAEEPAPIRRLAQTASSLPEPQPSPIRGRHLALAPALFADDAMILDQSAEPRPRLGRRRGGYGPTWPSAAFRQARALVEARGRLPLHRALAGLCSARSAGMASSPTKPGLVTLPPGR